VSDYTRLMARDGREFNAWLAAPAGQPRGAVVVLQEIFGLNAHIRAVADGYAAAGYLAIAPALFDRVQRDYDTGYTQPEIQAGIAVMQKVDIGDAIRDTSAAAAHVKGAGKVALVGYCWGGTIAWVGAARIPELACTIPYYGGGIPSFAGEMPKVPVLFHFGELDKSPTPEQARAVSEAHSSTVAHFYPAGHGFNCDQRGSYHAESSQLARERTLAFLAKHLG